MPLLLAHRSIQRKEEPKTDTKQKKENNGSLQKEDAIFIEGGLHTTCE